jgi:hypothetical protein
LTHWRRAAPDVSFECTVPIAAVPRREHALDVLKAGTDPLWRRVVEWVREFCSYRTGLVHRHISMRGLAAELRVTVEAVKAAVRRAKRRGLVAVWKRGPLGMPYFALVVVFCQKYRRDAGIGTLLALMLPYSIVFLLAWSLLLVAWLALGLPLGVGG